MVVINKMINLVNLVEPFTNTQLLLFLLVIYLITIYLSLKFDIKVMFLSAVLWLIPLTWFDDVLMVVIFVIMFLLHVILPLGSIGGNNDDF